MSDQLDTAATLGWITRFITTVTAHADELTDLDRRSGDGDFGTNITSALGRASDTLASSTPDTVLDVFTALVHSFLRHTGGTSGPLFGMWFREFALVSKDRATLDLAALAVATSSGLATVQRLGNAAVGDKTMVDAIAPAASTLNSAASQALGLTPALRSAAASARAGAEHTATILARRGRASYVGDASMGVTDPGALTIALFYESAVSVADAGGADALASLPTTNS